MAGHAPHSDKPPNNDPASGIPAGAPGLRPASGLPATRRERPPFSPGNPSMLTHGARTPRVYGPLAEMLAAGLTADRPDLAAYPEAVASWATAEAQAALLRRHLWEVGTIDPETSQPRAKALEWLHRTENAAAKDRAVLGLDPLNEARLSRERAAAATLAVDLDALAERGRAVLAAREQAGLPAPPDLAGTVLAEVRTTAEAAQAAHAAAWLAEHYPDAQAQPQALDAQADGWAARLGPQARPNEPALSPLVLDSGQLWGEAATDWQRDDARALLTLDLSTEAPRAAFPHSTPRRV